MLKKMKSPKPSSISTTPGNYSPSLADVSKILALVEEDISFRRFAILLACKASDDLQTNKSLADYFGVSPGGMSQSLARLERVGLVARTPHPHKREILISVTRKGDKLLHALGAWASS